MTDKVVLAFVTNARHCEVVWYALEKESLFPYDYDDNMLVILEKAVPLNRVLSDGTENWQDGGVKIRSICCKEYESRE